jgi:hypothetical protein
MKNKSKATKSYDKAVEQSLKSVVDGSRKALSKPGQDYLRLLVDPRGAKLVPSIYSLGGFAGQVGLVRTRTRGVAKIGSAGYGFVFTNAHRVGPYIDRSAAIYTDASYAGTASSAPPNSTTTGGVLANNWSKAPFTAAGSTAAELSFRPIASAIYVYPRSNKLSQDGDIVMLEEPGHIFASNALSLQNIESHSRSRVLTGAQQGDPRVENVLNWHPRGGTAGISSTSNDFRWTTQGASSANGANIDGDFDLMVLFHGTTGIEYHFEVVTVYECIGFSATALRTRLVDDRSWNIIQNAFASKTVSGWVGNPAKAEHSYLSAAWHWGKKLLGNASAAYRNVDRALVQDLLKVAGFAT